MEEKRIDKKFILCLNLNKKKIRGKNKNICVKENLIQL